MDKADKIRKLGIEYGAPVDLLTDANDEDALLPVDWEEQYNKLPLEKILPYLPIKVVADLDSSVKQIGLWLLMTQGGEIFTYGNDASTDVPFANEGDVVDQAKYLYEKANDKDPITCYLLRTFDNGQVKTELFDEDQCIEEGS